MDFLALVKRAARESGTISGSGPSTVIDQTGRNLTVVDAVTHAWDLIQSHKATWKWLRAEFTANLTAVTPPTEARYTAASFGLTRFADWIHDYPGYKPMRIYRTASGLADEARMTEMTWEAWKDKYGIGVQTADKPTQWAAAPDLRLCLGKPPPEACVLRGEYQKGNQTLSANTDVPEMPERFHMAIVWRAVLLITEGDEAEAAVYSRAEAKYSEILGSLERDQLPSISVGGGPIA